MMNLLLSLLLLVPSAPIDPIVADHYERIAAEYDRRVDREGAAYFRALARGERRTAPEIEAEDRAAHEILAGLYDEQADVIRRGRDFARRAGDTIFLQRVEIGAAHLAAMRYELSKGRAASRHALRNYLRDSRSWICRHHLPEEPLPPAVLPPRPPRLAAEIQATPDRITRGESTVLIYRSEGATRVEILPGVGSVEPNVAGRRVVFPIESTTYRIIAEGPAGREEKTDFVEVVEPPAPTLLPEVLGRIHFDFDLWEIRADGVDTLAAVADFMRRHPDVRVLIEGHTDAKASEEYNIPLSNRRAEAARDYLVERHGIPASRLVTVGLGKSRFIAPNERDGKDYPEGRALNRRVEFRVLKTATP